MADKSLTEKMQDEITGKLEEAFESVVDSKNRHYKEHPETVPRMDGIGNLISAVALKNSAISGGASLVPGPWGMLAVVPELMLVIRNQIGLIYDIGAAHGQRNIITKELAAAIFVSGLGTSTGSLLVAHGGKFLVRRSSLQVFQKVIAALGGKIAQQTLKSAVSKWLPGVGAAAMAAWTNYMTRQVGKKADEIFKKGLVADDGIADINVPDVAGKDGVAGASERSLEYCKLKILTNLAKVDGVVRGEEEAFITDLIESSDLAPVEKNELYSRLKSKEKDIDGIDLLSQSPDDAIALLADMTALAKKDNELHVLEKLYVRQIGKLLNFSERDIDDVLDA